MGISTADLASLRTDAETFLPETVTIQRATPASDSAGGQTYSWATSSTAWGRLTPTGMEEKHLAERITAEASHTLRVPSGTDIDPKDRVVISGLTYQVAQVLAPRSYEVYRIAALVRLS